MKRDSEGYDTNKIESKKTVFFFHVFIHLSYKLIFLDVFVLS